MEINLKIKELDNDMAVYHRLSLSHLPEETQKEVLEKSRTGHTFDELETGQIIHGTWTG